MRALYYEIGKKFKNKELGFILEVVELEDCNLYFENTDNGDIYSDVDEDLYIEIE